MEQDYEEII